MIGNKGFTLIEILVTTAVMALVFLLGTTVLVGFFQTQSQTQTQLELEGAIRQIESVVREEIMEATAITMQDNEVQLRNREGRMVRIMFDGTGINQHLLICRGDECATTNPQTHSTLFSSLNPSETHFTTGLSLIYHSDVAHPLITLVLQLADDKTDKTSSRIQFSITSRSYVP